MFESHPSQPRNEFLANVFIFAEYIDAWGRGINKIVEACQKNELPAPEFKEDFGGLQVTLYRNFFNEKDLKALGLNERQIKCVLYLNENGKITISEYRDLVGVKDRTVLDDFNILRELDIIVKMGDTGRSTHYLLKTRNKPARSLASLVLSLACCRTKQVINF